MHRDENDRIKQIVARMNDITISCQKSRTAGQELRFMSLTCMGDHLGTFRGKDKMGISEQYKISERRGTTLPGSRDILPEKGIRTLYRRLTSFLGLVLALDGL
jgi:hypothetical protein